MKDTIYILCEGYTESLFIRDVLSPNLEDSTTRLCPIILQTKITKQGKIFRGGASKYQSIKKQIQELCFNKNAIAVTTMLDFYGLPNDFPGKNSIPSGNCFQKVNYLETELSRDINNNKFLPYFSLHEFEALVLSDIQIVSEIIGNMQNEAKFHREISVFSSPEEINDGDNTHPSERIEKYVTNYQKISHGVRITKKIGITALKRKCAHFNAWYSQLERFKLFPL